MSSFCDRCDDCDDCLQMRVDQSVDADVSISSAVLFDASCCLPQTVRKRNSSTLTIQSADQSVLDEPVIQPTTQESTRTKLTRAEKVQRKMQAQSGDHIIVVEQTNQQPPHRKPKPTKAQLREATLGWRQNTAQKNKLNNDSISEKLDYDIDYDSDDCCGPNKSTTTSPKAKAHKG